MDNIKKINTGVAEIIAVKVPVTGMKYNLETDGDKYILFFGEGKDMKVRLLHSGYKYEALGFSDQLTKEQLKRILPNSVLADMLDLYKTVWNKLMEVNGCYSVNPLGQRPKPYDDPKFNNTYMGYNGYMHALSEENIKKWQQAEANTGPYLILTRSKS